MKIRDLFENWNLTGLSVKTGIMNLEWSPSDPDKDAAWDLYVELLTRVTTQPLAKEDGVEEAALASIHALFDITRQTLKEHGRPCVEFSRIAIIVLNQIVRPFTAKWHQRCENGVLDTPAGRDEFREDLHALQEQLINYTGLLAELADVEDLTGLEPE